MIPLKDSIPARIFAFWTFVIIALNLYVFFQQLTTSDPQGFVTQYALIPSLVNFNDWNTLLPFFTSQFLHGGFLHIASNMLFLWVFGDNVEEAFGYFFYPIIYLLSGFMGGLAQYVFMPDSTIPMLGASGAVAGVLGAYFALFPHHKVKTLVLIPFIGFFTIIDIAASVMLIYWFVTQLFSGTASLGLTEDVGGVAYFAHIGGFVFGWIAAKLLARPKAEQLTS